MKEVQILSDYQRFISYIYEYKNQEKAQNCGFSKVEVRNGQCRLEIHMKPGPYPYNPEFQVYTFVSLRHKLQGIPLGNIRYQQGALNGVYSFSKFVLADKDYTLQDLGGILIQADTGQIFASAWKDYDIRPADFSLEKPQIEYSMDVPDECQETPIHAASISYDIQTENPVLLDTLPKPDTMEKHLETNPCHPFDASATDENTETLAVESSTTDYAMNRTESTPTESSADNPSQTTNRQRIFPFDYWEDFQQTYPQVHPFFDDEIHNCLQFSPEHLDYLSTLGFSMNHNRFFQHACDNYHHFIIGFSSQENLPVLAIPGIYSELEHYLASAFGFPYFKPAHHEANFPGQFVYWFKPL